MDPQTLVRATEIGAAVLVPLVREIADALHAGRTEEEATRTALARLAALPDLAPVLPRVQAMIAAARAEHEGQ